jgi:hypothetical protein
MKITENGGMVSGDKSKWRKKEAKVEVLKHACRVKKKKI